MKLVGLAVCPLLELRFGSRRKNAGAVVVYWMPSWEAVVWRGYVRQRGMKESF